MKIGEIVENLIYIKDHTALYGQEYEAVIEACNLLDKLPRLQKAAEYEPEQTK